MATSTPLIEKAWWRTETRSTAEDSVVVALHGLLLSRDFVCVSISDEDFSEDQHAFSGSILSSPDSPALPEGWKKDGVYTLVYQKKTSGRRILIKGLKMDSDLLILNAAVAGTESVSNVTVTTSEFVNSAGGLDSMSGAFKDMDKMLSMLEKDLLSKVDPAPNTAKPTAAQSRPGDSHSSLPTPDGPSRPPPLAEPLRDPLRIGPPHYPQGHPLAGGIGGVPFGRGDLDPFNAGVGGGMMFDPLRVGGRHGGGLADPRLPPGARYDPVGPQPLGPRPPGRGGPSPGNYPDPDHLPPPGMGGNYYM